MAPSTHRIGSGRTSRSWLAAFGSVVGALTACSGDESPNGSNAAGASATGGSAGVSASGGAGAMAGASKGGSAGSGSPGGAGGATGGVGTSGGTSGSGGASGAGATAGKSGAAGSGFGGDAARAGASGSGAASGGPAGGMGGTPEGGRGGMAGGNASGAGGSGTPTGCTRELLKSTIDAFFTALAAHDPAGLPLADNVKFTENGEELELGEAGLWTTAGAVKYTQSALDVTVCTAALHGVVPDGSTDIPIALRLKLADQKLTEIELIAVRQGDYSVASNPGAMISANNTVGWEDPVTADKNTRAELVAWMDKYYREFPSGVCNVTSDCKRLENGGGNFNCSTGASCAAGAPMGDPMLDPRLILGDEETGIGVGFTMFQGQYTDMHMFKMYGGEVHAVHAILASAGMSGW